MHVSYASYRNDPKGAVRANALEAVVDESSSVLALSVYTSCHGNSEGVKKSERRKSKSPSRAKQSLGKTGMGKQSVVQPCSLSAAIANCVVNMPSTAAIESGDTERS